MFTQCKTASTHAHIYWFKFSITSWLIFNVTHHSVVYTNPNIMLLTNLMTLCIYAIIFELVICLEIINTTTNNMMYLTNADDTLYFNYPFTVRNQIECTFACYKLNRGNTFYYALFKNTLPYYCVCKTDFDWRIIDLTPGAIELQRIPIRIGKQLLCHHILQVHSNIN